MCADHIRDSIQHSVDAIQYFESKGGLERAHESQIYSDIDALFNAEGERCHICTLPKGTCTHTSAWILQHDVEKALLEETAEAKNELEDEIHSALEFLSFESGNGGMKNQIEPDIFIEDIDIAHMHWEHLEERLSDKIGDRKVKLFTPDDRGWHTCVSLGNRYLVIFGGFRCKGRTPQPFQAVAEKYEVEYLADLRVYDQVTKSWKGVKAIGPKGRYGKNFVCCNLVSL